MCNARFRRETVRRSPVAADGLLFMQLLAAIAFCAAHLRGRGDLGLPGLARVAARVRSLLSIPTQHISTELCWPYLTSAALFSMDRIVFATSTVRSHNSDNYHNRLRACKASVHACSVWHAGTLKHAALAGGNHTYSVQSVEVRQRSRRTLYRLPKPAATANWIIAGDVVPEFTSCELPVSFLGRQPLSST